MMITFETIPSQSDPPFAVAPDVVLDLPVPPSANRARKINWAWKRQVDAWVNVCNAYVLAAKARKNGPLVLTKIKRFELVITLSEAHTRIDLDNGLKALIDYLRRIEVVEDDSQKHMRRITVEWGHAPHGCRVTVKPLGPQSVNDVLRGAAETLERNGMTVDEARATLRRHGINPEAAE